MFFDTTREGKTNKKRRKKAFREPTLEGAEGTIWSSENRSMADALEPSGEEGRGRLRKARGRSERPLIPGFPNGVTRTARAVHPNA